MLVIDASVAVKFVTEEPGSDEAYEIVIGPEPLIAPEWVLAECANAIVKKVLREGLPRAKAQAGFDELPRFFSKLVATEELLERAFYLALDIGHAYYDCLYLALALRDGAVVVTADEDFARSARRAGFEDHMRFLMEKSGR